MPNQLLGWDADFYKSLSDTTRNVSLSDKEIYVLGNLLPMVSWSTRWSGDLTGLDIDAIRGEMEFTLLDEITGGTMSCTDIADCIETDETVQAAIEQSMINDGFVPNPETNLDEAPPPTLTATASAKNLLPDTLDCENQPQIAMGLARAIVSELHQSAEDFFELVEYATNAAEGLAMAAEQIPYFGTAISGALEFMDWVLETMSETYLAAYNQSVEDELSCMIFCHIMDNCTLSIDDLTTLYEDKGSITVPPLNDLEAILTFAIETPFDPDVVCVAVFHYQVLRFMSWGAIGGFSAAYLQSLLKNNVSASDFSYEDLCDDCVTETPTNYWKLYYDFRTGGQQNTEEVAYGSPADGMWVGNGYAYDPSVSSTALQYAAGISDLGAQYVITAAAMREVRRGSTGNGTNDIAVMAAFPNAAYGGTGANFHSVGGINANTNKVETGTINELATGLYRSIRWFSKVNRHTTTYTGEKALRLYEAVIWGEAGAGDTKPPRAIWAGNTLPTTVPELFPDYVAP